MNYGELKTSIQDYCQNSETSFVAHIPDFVRSAEDKAFLSVQMPAFWKSDSFIQTLNTVPEYTLAPGAMDVLSVRVGEGSVPGAAPGTGAPPKDFSIGVQGTAGEKVFTEAAPSPLAATLGVSVGDIVTLPVMAAGVNRVTKVTGTTLELEHASVGSGTIILSISQVTPEYVVSAGPVRYLLRKDYDFLLEAYPGTGIPVGGSVPSPATGLPKYYAVSDASDTASEPTMTIRLGPIPDSDYPVTVDYYGKTAADSITVSDSTTTWLSVVFPDTLLYGSLVEAYIYMKGEPDLIQTYTTQFQNSLMMIKNLGEGRQTRDSFASGTKRVDSQ